jgi:hypothetical protein
MVPAAVRSDLRVKNVDQPRRGGRGSFVRPL